MEFISGFEQHFFLKLRKRLLVSKSLRVVLLVYTKYTLWRLSDVDRETDY